MKDNGESLFYKIVKIGKKENSEEEAHKVLSELKIYCQKVPPFDTNIFK